MLHTSKLSRDETKKLITGQYFVVIQHPMMNNEFDVYLDESNKKVLSNYWKKEPNCFQLMVL